MFLLIRTPLNLQHAAANDLGVDKGELERRLDEVSLLLPNFRQQLKNFRPQSLALLVADPRVS